MNQNMLSPPASRAARTCGSAPSNGLVGGTLERTTDSPHARTPPWRQTMERESTLNAIVHSLLEERVLVDDPEWDTVSVLVSITPGVADMTAFRFTASGPGKPTPVRSPRFDLFRRLQGETAAPDGMMWQVCIIRLDRDSRRAGVEFVYGDDAEQWRVTPASRERIGAALRTRG